MKSECRRAIYAAMFMMVVHCLGIAAELTVNTEPEVKAVRGLNITLPCNFSGDIVAVYWYRLNHTGAQFNNDNLYVSIFKGQASNRAGPRFSITDDYGMTIVNVSVMDETTYSCEVAFSVENTGGSGVARNHTDVRVIALADPMHPEITDCAIRTTNSCDYTVGQQVSETFPLTCRVDRVRPAVKLTWKDSDGVEQAGRNVTRGPDKDGLYDVSLEVQVSKTKIGDTMTCEAIGEAVNGTALMVVSIQNPPEEPGGLSGGVIAIIVIFVVIIVTGVPAGVVILFLWKRNHNNSRDMVDGAPLLSPQEEKLKNLRADINEYVPGAFSPLERSGNRTMPDRTRLAVYGVTRAGKSSFIRSLIYALKEKYIGIDISAAQSTGGVTLTPKPYSVTEHISVIDNRGLRDLDEKLIPNIMKDIKGENEGPAHGSRVYCPILIFDARQPVRALDGFLKTFVQDVREEFGSFPVVIFTHRDGIPAEKQGVIKAEVSGYGALDQKLFFVQNITEDPAGRADVELTERCIEFVELLKKLLSCADENLDNAILHQSTGRSGTRCGLRS